MITAPVLESVLHNRFHSFMKSTYGWEPRQEALGTQKKYHPYHSFLSPL